MGLFVIVVALLAQHLIHGRFLALPDIWYEKLAQQISKSAKNNQLLESWLLVLLPATALLLLQYSVENYWLWLGVDSLVLFYAFGVIKIRSLLNAVIAKKLSPEEFELNLEALAMTKNHSSQLAWFDENLVYVAFSRFFLLVFCYVLGGAPLVLLVHLCQLQSYRSACPASMKQALRWIEWPASRLLMTTMALMGDFVAVLAKMISLGFTFSTHQELSDCAKASINADAHSFDGEQLSVILDLIERCRLLWLGLLAVWFLLVK